MDSKFLSLNWQDGLKALVMVFLSAFVTAIYKVIEVWAASGTFPDGPGIVTALKTAGFVGIAAAVAYLAKNFFSGVPAPTTDNPAK